VQSFEQYSVLSDLCVDYACRSVVALPYFISFYSLFFLFFFPFFSFSFFSYRYCNDYALLCSVFAMAFDRCLIKDYLLTYLLTLSSTLLKSINAFMPSKSTRLLGLIGYRIGSFVTLAHSCPSHLQPSLTPLLEKDLFLRFGSQLRWSQFLRFIQPLPSRMISVQSLFFLLSPKFLKA